MGALTGLIAHGGVAGAVVEALVALAVLGVLAAAWFRERGGSRGEGPARLRDEDEAPRP